MSVNFSSLVLAPCMATFALPITVTPTVSMPTAAPYDARAVWKIDAVNIITEDGGLFSNRTIKIGVRMSEFTVLPVQGDGIGIVASYLPLAYAQNYSDPTSIINFIVDDQNPDGQGGASLTLKLVIS